MNTSELVHPRHLSRQAMIYVRQSSPSQVITNKESQRMQYAWRERATSLGWHQQDTHVIDADLGRSGTTINERQGFQYLVAQIALGTVDIQWKRVTAASVSRFLNNPAYAGAAVYGRTRWKKAENTGKMPEIKLPRNQWRYCVRDKFPPSIAWKTFERIQTMLHDNYAEYARNKTRGVPRAGKALLHGIVGHTP
ncbi:MAG: recombinase family protein [Planctomycetota bacterium]